MYDLDFDFTAEHPKADMSGVDRIIVNGKVYTAVDRVLEIIEKYKNFPRDYNPLKYIRNEIIALKGGEQE